MTFALIMSTIKTFNRLYLSIFFCFVSFMMCAETDFETITAIILINGNAELVDVNIEGDILKRHLSIPDYFTSGRSHKRSLGMSMKMIKQYGSVDTHLLPNSSKLPAKCLQSFMIAMSEKIETDCFIQNTPHFYYATSSDLSVSYTHVNFGHNKGYREGRRPRQRMMKQPISFYSDLDYIYFKNKSSDSAVIHVSKALKFFSAKSKEPLRRRIV